MEYIQERFTSHAIRQQKSDGSTKYREIMIPSDETRERHEAMLETLYSLSIPMPHATGGIPGKQLLDNVRPHQQNNDFLMLDLESAFGSVDIEQLISVVHSPVIPARYQNSVVEFIDEWATTPDVNGLPLGAPCSPMLFNISCIPMDRELAAYTSHREIEYTRYLDDLTFSSRNVIGKRRRKDIRDIIHRHAGKKINNTKTRHHSLLNGPVTITGVSIQPDRRMQPSPVLLELAKTTFVDIATRANSGEEIFADDIGRLHGWNGVLESLYTAQTPTSRQLKRLYKLGVTAIKH